MDENKTIDGYPSVKAFIQYGDKSGVLHLSSIYGSYNIESEIFVPMDEMVIFFCPFCRASLQTRKLCSRCHASMAFFELKHGGKVEICSRRGCKEHFIEFSSLEQKTSALYDLYERFKNSLGKE